jgi:hypothetical protein
MRLTHSDQMSGRLDDFNDLERAVLNWFKDHYPSVRLAEQIDAAQFRRREWTRVGYHVHLYVPRQLRPLNLSEVGSRWPISGPDIESDDVEHGGGTLVWGNEGYVDSIEIFAFGHFFRQDVQEFRLIDPVRQSGA